ncbi:helix-turn-helix transcriptional regulator [Pseudoclavibacter sp. JSM 162008]|uniref:helix-turn-helix transcriptional regulator n=1 Tax=Pseudoclavibacter sp. JSM 162008 TaxID=3229855 RepID=UPI003526693B
MTTFTFDSKVLNFDVRVPGQLAALETTSFDAYPAETNGEITVTFTVDAPSPAEALVIVEAQMRRLGFPLFRVDFELLTVSGVAEMLGCSRETARLYASGARRGGFPKPFSTTGDTKLWAWADVFDWAIAQGLLTTDDLDLGAPLPVRVVERFNGGLAAKRQQQSDGWDRVLAVGGKSESAGAEPGCQSTAVVLSAFWPTALGVFDPPAYLRWERPRADAAELASPTRSRLSMTRS